jgi:hypothetical protein
MLLFIFGRCRKNTWPVRRALPEKVSATDREKLLT